MKNAQKDKTKIFIGVLIAVILILASAVVYFAFFSDSRQDDINSGKGLSLAADAEVWDKTLENSGNESAGIKIPGYGEITVSQNAEKANITLVNPEGNPCYFEYTLKADGSVLYRSDLIEPGKAVKEIPLTNVPQPGTYDLVLQIKTYSLDENLSPMNGAEVKTTLVVT